MWERRGHAYKIGVNLVPNVGSEKGSEKMTVPINGTDWLYFTWLS